MNNIIKKIKSNNTIAYKNEKESITYESLLKQAYLLKKELIKEGTSPIIIYGRNEVCFIITIIAALLSKRPYIPVDISLPRDRLLRIINDSQASLIITMNNAYDYQAISKSNIPISINKLQTTNIKRNNKKKTAYIIYTSGTTGIPKGVPISYKNLRNFIKWISNIKPFCYYKNKNILNTAKYSFDLSVASIYYSLINHHTLFSINNDILNNYNILKYIKDNNINIIIMTPTYAQYLLLDNSFNSTNYKYLECIFFCGEKLEKKIVLKIKDRFKNIKIINAYGPTEATCAVSAIEITDEILENKFLPVGHINNFATKVKIVNNEIVLSGKSVFEGYINNKSKIKEYKTGDIGKIENKMLYCLGRNDEQIKYKGYRIELADIEKNLLEINEIENVAVIPKYDCNKNIKFIRAYIILNKKIEIADIKKELLKKIPPYMIPKSIIIVKEFPMNQNGKCDKERMIKYD